MTSKKKPRQLGSLCSFEFTSAILTFRRNCLELEIYYLPTKGWNNTEWELVKIRNFRANTFACSVGENLSNNFPESIVNWWGDLFWFLANISESIRITRHMADVGVLAPFVRSQTYSKLWRQVDGMWACRHACDATHHHKTDTCGSAT